MRLWILSDLQLTHHSDPRWIAEERIPEADLAVVTGDAFPPLDRSLQALAWLAKRLPLVYVPGNRDFYVGPGGIPFDGLIEHGRALARGLGIHLLYNESVEIGGVRVLGATLWTDYALDGDPEGAMREASSRVSDHWTVRTDKGGFSPDRARAEHAASVAFLQDGLARPFAGTTVVATHHAPHRRSLSPLHTELNAAFASDLSRLMEGPDAPGLWVHGGIHHNVDYVVGGTRVLSNSRGYPGENPAFRPDLVVDLEAPEMVLAP